LSTFERGVLAVAVLVPFAARTFKMARAALTVETLARTYSLTPAESKLLYRSITTVAPGTRGATMLSHAAEDIEAGHPIDKARKDELTRLVEEMGLSERPATPHDPTTGESATGKNSGAKESPSSAPSEPAAKDPIEGAVEVTLSQDEYRAALAMVYPSQFGSTLARVVDGVGERAAQRALSDTRFVNAVQSRNWKLAGTLFHSAAAIEVRALGAGALPPGWRIEAELVIQAGAGGSRADVLLFGPAGELVEFDWKTTGRSALSSGSRSEMTRHAGQIAINIGGKLSHQQSVSWVDYMRPLMPGVKWPR
jgi:hypothetical protein